MEPEPLIDAVMVATRALDSVGARYMVTGSVAGIVYGRQRSTVDVDIIVDMASLDVARLAQAMAPGYFVDIEMGEESRSSGVMFNAIGMHGGPKIDLIPLSSDDHERMKFERRVLRDWHGDSVWMITAEDLVLSKLAWSKTSSSERQLADVRAILASGAVRDRDYLSFWAQRLGVVELLDASRTTGYDA